MVCLRSGVVQPGEHHAALVTAASVLAQAQAQSLAGDAQSLIDTVIAAAS